MLTIENIASVKTEVMIISIFWGQFALFSIIFSPEGVLPQFFINLIKEVTAFLAVENKSNKVGKKSFKRRPHFYQIIIQRFSFFLLKLYLTNRTRSRVFSNNLLHISMGLAKYEKEERENLSPSSFGLSGC